jgi:ribosomal protein S18 acetylase RimI-like enzyme
MTDRFNIVNTEKADLVQIHEFFAHSIAYQKANGYPVWENYDRGAIVRDIDEKNQYKAVNAEGIGIVFSVGYHDEIIWREMDQGESIYLHRIVVNPDFKGQSLFRLIVDWALEHIHQKGLKSVRMDTWAANKNIIEYYKKFGFAVVEHYTTPDTQELPVHNRNLALTLMEYRHNN